MNTSDHGSASALKNNSGKKDNEKNNGEKGFRPHAQMVRRLTSSAEMLTAHLTKSPMPVKTHLVDSSGASQEGNRQLRDKDKLSHEPVSMSPPPPPVSEVSDANVKEGSNTDNTEGQVSGHDLSVTRSVSPEYEPGPAHFFFIRFGDDQKRMLNSRCRCGILMKTIRSIVGMSVTKGELDLVSLTGEILGLNKIDFNESLHRVVAERETYVPCTVVIEDGDFCTAIEPFLSESALAESWWEPVRDRLDMIILKDSIRREQEMEKMRREKKVEEDKLRKQFEKEMRELATKKDKEETKVKPKPKK